MADPPRDSSPSTGVADLAAEFYEKTPRYDFDSSLARRREELGRFGATTVLIEELRRAFPSTSIPEVLEVGGEYATTLSVLRETFQVGTATSCDLVLPNHQIEGIRYVSAPAESLARTFPSRSFDLVLMIDVIEHLYDPDRVIDEIRSVLKPSGVLAIVTPNLASWLNRLLLLSGHMPLDTEVSTRAIFGRPGPKDGPPAGHIRVFTLRALEEFLRYHRFAVVGSRTAPLGFGHPTYVDPDGVASAGGGSAGSKPADPVRGGRLIRAMLGVDKVMARAAPSMGSRIVLVARAEA